MTYIVNPISRDANHDPTCRSDSVKSVRNVYGRLPFPSLLQPFEEIVLCFRIKSGARFIQQQKIRRMKSHERTRQSNTLPLSAGEICLHLCFLTPCEVVSVPRYNGLKGLRQGRDEIKSASRFSSLLDCISIIDFRYRTDANILA